MAFRIKSVIVLQTLSFISMADGRQPLHEPPPGYSNGEPYISDDAIYQPWRLRTTPGNRRIGLPSRQEQFQGGSISAQGSIVELGGWGIDYPDNSTSPVVVSLQTSRNPRACLDSCQETVGCRFVSFNLDNNRCTGYTSAFGGVFRPNTSSSLLAYSTRKFAKTRGAAVVGDFIEGRLTVTGEHVANDLKVFNEDVCFMLCRIHPKCVAANFKAAIFHTDVQSDQVECGLAWSLNKLKADKVFSSYVSA